MSEFNRARPALSGPPVLHRSLDVQGHAELAPNASGVSTNETYQDASGQHLWSLKRFPGVPSTDESTDNNPEEVEQVRK
ncbi:hypothetical protein [Paenarthrobacter nitroguajacolicus]|uniref:hypothetical protein n=1 Tax=Paenarthrobacter nitroguajacolicus TaxID=211146 RepID=UPI002861E7FE|nr:hypothetical protein [Paenarthrobacter nitroguajacolicus]MDR6639935.1 hypothetical protein [Paenarthrobacter nitroguajacolicus]